MIRNTVNRLITTAACLLAVASFPVATLPVFTGALEQERTPIIFIHLLELAG
jgi:hypothetical protein